MFGEVERCNWVPECVQAWDANTATWERLTPEDKMSQLATARTNAEAAQKAAEDAYREAEAKGEQVLPPPPPPGAPGAPPLAEFLNMEP